MNKFCSYLFFLFLLSCVSTKGDLSPTTIGNNNLTIIAPNNSSNYSQTVIDNKINLYNQVTNQLEVELTQFSKKEKELKNEFNSGNISKKYFEKENQKIQKQKQSKTEQLKRIEKIKEQWQKLNKEDKEIKKIDGSSIYQGFENNECLSIFDNSKPNKFKVLILPFIPTEYGYRDKCVGYSIYHRLKELKKELNIIPEYCPSIISPSDKTDAIEIRKKYNADFLIYGMVTPFRKESCENSICFRYSLSEEIADSLNVPYETLKHELLFDFDKDVISSTDIIEGKMSSEINQIIYWVSGLSLVKQNKFNEAILQFEKIVNDFNFDNDEVLKELGGLYIKVDKKSKALDIANKLISRDSTNVSAYEMRINSDNSFENNLRDRSTLIKIDKRRMISHLLSRVVLCINRARECSYSPDLCNGRINNLHLLVVEDYTRLIKIKEKQNCNCGSPNWMLYKQRAIEYYSAGKYEEGEKDYHYIKKQVIGTKGEHSWIEEKKDLDVAKAYYYYNIGNYKKALVSYVEGYDSLSFITTLDYDKIAISCVSIDDFEWVKNTLANSKFKKDDIFINFFFKGLMRKFKSTLKAEKHYKELIKKKPNSSFSYYMLSLNSFYISQYKNRADFFASKALSLNSNDKFIIYWINFLSKNTIDDWYHKNGYSKKKGNN